MKNFNDYTKQSAELEEATGIEAMLRKYLPGYGKRQALQRNAANWDAIEGLSFVKEPEEEKLRKKSERHHKAAKKYSDILHNKRMATEETKEPTGDLKDACWKGYTAVGTKMKNGRKVPNCVPVKEAAEQIDENLMMAAAASANQPKYTERTAEQEKKHAERKAEKYLHMPGKNAAKKRKYWVKKVNKLHGITEEVEQIDEISKGLASRYMRQIERQPGLDKDHPEKRNPKKLRQQSIGYERAFNKVSPYGKHRVKVQATEEYVAEETPAWQRKEGKNPEGGLNQKGVESYRRENPGSKLQTAVTTEPSKLKKGSKSAKRRLSFCRRMKGMKEKLTSAETARDPDSRINKSLRKWNC